MNKHIFLSAGVPDPKRNPKYINTVDIVAIREAIAGLCVVASKMGSLVFGGQPAISSLVWMATNQLQAVDKVTIYQSEFFRNFIPKESLAFNRFVWTPSSVDNTRDGSLKLMRNKMLTSKKFDVGIFIGGMEGVEEEFEMFTQLNPNAQAFPVASTGAAAKILFDRQLGSKNLQIRNLLMNEYVYTWLFESLIKQNP